MFHEGYQRRDWDKKHPNIPSILTIFSAPNYCGIYGNYGAILHIKVISYPHRTIASKLNNTRNRLYIT